MNNLRQALTGEIWTLCYQNNDPDPWIYLVLSFDHDGVNMLALYANTHSQSCVVHEPYEDLLDDLLWRKLIG